MALPPKHFNDPKYDKYVIGNTKNQDEEDALAWLVETASDTYATTAWTTAETEPKEELNPEYDPAVTNFRFLEFEELPPGETDFEKQKKREENFKEYMEALKNFIKNRELFFEPLSVSNDQEIPNNAFTWYSNTRNIIR